MNKFKIFLFFFILLISCKENSKSNNDNGTETSIESISTNEDETNFDESSEEYSDGTYCAEVEYYNPNTGTRSTYTLTIEVQSNEVVEINFPNGGWLDNDHFSGTELEEDGTASFTSDRGYQYEITIIGHSSNCFDSVPRAIQCRGETEEGEQCENMTDNPNGLCKQHQNQE